LFFGVEVEKDFRFLVGVLTRLLFSASLLRFVESMTNGLSAKLELLLFSSED